MMQNKKANKINNAAVTIQGAIKGHKARKALRDQQPKFKADYTDEEFKTKEIKKLRQLQQKTNKSEIEHTLFNALKTKYTGVQLKQPSEDLTKSISTLQATIKRGHIQPLYKAGLTNARATSTLQAGIKRAHIQPLYNEGLTNFRAARTIQGAIRNRTAKRDIMKQRQLVGEAELRQMEATKGQAIKDEAAKKLQATTKRIRPQNDLKQIRQAKEKIGAAAKSLLTEKVNSSYSPTINKTAIWNKNTVGQPLAVNKRFKLVSKKRHDAAVAGYENRAAYLDMAEHYKTIMTKGKK